jgi:hypothetical protein
MKSTDRTEQQLQQALTQQELAETQSEVVPDADVVPGAELEGHRESFQDYDQASDADSAIGSVSNYLCVTSLIPLGLQRHSQNAAANGAVQKELDDELEIEYLRVCRGVWTDISFVQKWQ